MATGFIQQLTDIKEQKAKLDEQVANGIALRERLSRECNDLEIKKKLLTQDTATLESDVASNRALKDEIVEKYNTVKAKHTELSTKVLEFETKALALDTQAQKMITDATALAESIVRDAEEAIKTTYQQIEGAKNTLGILRVSIEETNTAKNVAQKQERDLNEVISAKQSQLVDAGEKLKSIISDIRTQSDILTDISARVNKENILHKEIKEKVKKEAGTLETIRSERKALEAEVEHWNGMVAREKKKYEEAQKALTLLDDEKKALQEINNLLS